MACSACGSQKQKEFSAEMNIHFPGRKGLDKPVVWVFPELQVCLDCGLTLLTIPETELLLLENSISE